MSEGTERRLAAIVSADVVGYSRLMGADETGTLATVKAHRRELWSPIIQEYGGRIVGGAGDSTLVEFASAVAAMESSIAVQQGMEQRNADLPEDKRMLLRIGINIGEVSRRDLCRGDRALLWLSRLKRSMAASGHCFHPGPVFSGSTPAAALCLRMVRLPASASSDRSQDAGKNEACFADMRGCFATNGKVAESATLLLSPPCPMLARVRPK